MIGGLLLFVVVVYIVEFVFLCLEIVVLGCGMLILDLFNCDVVFLVVGVLGVIIMLYVIYLYLLLM